jgi:hypothetical protein
MTEQERVRSASSKRWHPFVQLFVENPISAFNMTAILFGGGVVYAQIGNYMRENDSRVARIETQIREQAIAANIKDDRSAAKTDGIARELNDVKVTVRGIESAVQFLVQQEQRRRPGQ